MRIYTKNGELYNLDENAQMKVGYYGSHKSVPKEGLERQKKLEEELKKDLESTARDLIILKNTKPGLFANKEIKNDYAEKVSGLEGKRKAIIDRLRNIEHSKRRYEYSRDFAETYFFSQISFFFFIEGVPVNFRYSDLEPESLEEILQNFFYITTDDALNEIREKNRAMVYEDGTRVWSDEEIEKFLQ